jgi:mono/diheme cytochrome c family protein
MKRTRWLAVLLTLSIVAFGLIAYAGETRETHPSGLFREYCAKCHGEDGKANTPKGKQLMARDFTDAEWQSAESDRDLIKVVTKGGEDMPAFGKKLSKEQIEKLVKEDVRGFAKKK